MKRRTMKTLPTVVIGCLAAMLAVLPGTARKVHALTTSECLGCHTPAPPATIATMHHQLTFECVYCHKPISDSTGGYTIDVPKDCTVCHGVNGHAAAHDHAKPNKAECTQCHNANVVVEHANRGLNCGTCHSSTDPKVVAAIAKGKGTTGQDVFCSDCHGTVNHHAQVNCNVCHASTGDSPTNDKCFQCHGSIKAKYDASNDKFAGFGTRKGYYATSNTKHDVPCFNCHNTHLAGSIANPENRSQAFTATIKHPGTGATVLDSTTFCVKCHDNTKAAGGTVTGTTMKNIAATYLSGASNGEQHGATTGQGRGVLRGPYAAAEWSSNTSGVPTMPCLDCHDPHAGNGLYILKTLTDQFGKPITLTSANITDNTARWCSQCHTNPMNQIDSNKVGCLSASCHSHGTSSW